MMARLQKIGAAYLAAGLASGYTLALGLLLLFWGLLLVHIPGPMMLFMVLLLAGGQASALAMIFAFVPALVAISVAEAMHLRSATYYCGTGTITAIVGWGLIVREGGLFPMPGFELSLIPGRWPVEGPLILIAGGAGLIGGLVYWRIAGRTTGNRSHNDPLPHPALDRSQ
jgi:hypothetical protein